MTLHWLLAVLIIAALPVGFLGSREAERRSGKIDVLRWHMAGGMLILALMIVRFIVRWRTAKSGAGQIDSLRSRITDSMCS